MILASVSLIFLSKCGAIPCEEKYTDNNYMTCGVCVYLVFIPLRAVNHWAKLELDKGPVCIQNDVNTVIHT